MPATTRSLAKHFAAHLCNRANIRIVERALNKHSMWQDVMGSSTPESRIEYAALSLLLLGLVMEHGGKAGYIDHLKKEYERVSAALSLDEYQQFAKKNTLLIEGVEWSMRRYDTARAARRAK